LTGGFQAAIQTHGPITFLTDPRRYLTDKEISQEPVAKSQEFKIEAMYLPEKGLFPCTVVIGGEVLSLEDFISICVGRTAFHDAYIACDAEHGPLSLEEIEKITDPWNRSRTAPYQTSRDLVSKICNITWFSSSKVVYTFDSLSMTWAGTTLLVEAMCQDTA
jgi:hypothetical protein